MTPPSHSPHDARTRWFYADPNNEPQGPVSREALSMLAAAGGINSKTQVIEEGGSSWKAYGALLPAYPHPQVSEAGGPGASCTPPLTQQTWYYSQNGTRIGPVTEYQLRALVATQTIHRDSLVWREGMADWTPAHQADIRQLFGSKPPPLTGEGVSNGLVWTVAFVPILAVAIQAFLAEASKSQPSAFWWVALPLNIALCYFDERKLKKAGHDTKRMGVLAMAFVPAYLFMRASRLKQNKSYAIVWIVTFLLSLGV